MSDVIDFMERMGGDARLQQASMHDLAAALADTDMAPALQSAVLAGDAPKLATLLGTKPVCILVAPPTPPGPSGPDPIRPAIPPPPGDDGEEEEAPTDSSAHNGAESPLHRRQPRRA